MRARPCTDVRADLSAYREGDLEPGLADATREHLRGCEACRSELELLRLTVQTLRRLPDLPPPAAILTGVRARLRPEPWHRRLFAGRQWLLGAPLGAVATVLVIVGIALFQSRYPGIEQMASRETAPRSPAPEQQAAPAPARKDPGAKGAREAAPLPYGSTRAGGADGAASSSAVEANARDRHPGVAPPPAAAPQPAQPAGAAAPADDAAVESKAEVVQPARQQPPAAALQDTFRENAQAGAQPAAAPPDPDRGVGAIRALEKEVRTSPAPEATKQKAAAADRTPDGGATMEYARLEEAKAPASPGIRVVGLLSPDGGTVEDIEELLRREGALNVAVDALEAREMREAFAPHRGRRGIERDPSRGWAITARVPSPARVRLLAALASRSGLRILEQPDAPTSPEAPTGALELRVILLR